MVPSNAITTLRASIPFWGLLALVSLFLKLPEIPQLLSFFECKTCSTHDPYIPLMGAGYFSFLIALSLLFPGFPSRSIALGGVIWAVLLALTMTYITLPGVCVLCLVAHFCNIIIWSIWFIAAPSTSDEVAQTVQTRIYLAAIAPIAVVALFSCLNLTFMAYGFKLSQNPLVQNLQAGEAIPEIAVKHVGDKPVILNFVSPNCPYCKEQIAVLVHVEKELAAKGVKFLNVSPTLTPELVSNAASAEWLEDPEGIYKSAFKVSGYPTLFVLGTDGRILQALPGVSEDFSSVFISIVRDL